MYLLDWRECWERTDFLRDRTHPSDTDIRWWITFEEIQIQTRRNCDHNWLHWMGHCDQQSYRFLKLAPPLHVSLLTRRSLPVVIIFKMCVWRVDRGGSEPPRSETSFISNLSVGSVSDVLNYPRNENRGRKVKINKHYSAADDGLQAADKKRGQSASSSWGHLKSIVGKIMDFPDLKTKTSDQPFRSKLTSRACEPRAGLTSRLAYRD